MKLILRSALFGLSLSLFSQNTFAEVVDLKTCLNALLNNQIAQTTTSTRMTSGGPETTFIAYMPKNPDTILYFVISGPSQIAAGNAYMGCSVFKIQG